MTINAVGVPFMRMALMFFLLMLATFAFAVMIVRMFCHGAIPWSLRNQGCTVSQ